MPVMQECSSDCHGPLASFALEMDDLRHREGIEIAALTDRARERERESPVGITPQREPAMKRYGFLQGRIPCSRSLITEVMGDVLAVRVAPHMMLPSRLRTSKNGAIHGLGVGVVGCDRIASSA